MAATAFSCFSTAEEVTDGIDASDRTAIVTGATSGIGAETARVLALRGAQVVLAVRNVGAGERVAQKFLQEIPHARLHVLHLELSSMASVRTFCHSFKALNLPLNILINNAGMAPCPFKLSPDGLEMQFATNYIGPFLLTSLLLDDMKRAAKETGIQGKVVNVSSIFHDLYTYPGGIRFDQLNDESSYNPECAYGQSKLANILHAKELSRTFHEERVNVVANAVDPGAIHTNIFNGISDDTLQQWIKQYENKYKETVFWKSIPQGAATQCLLALHPSTNIKIGKYFANCQEAKPSEISCDLKLAKDLWDFSVNVTSLI